ncbi:MAG TPA: acetate--CoA ligase [Thermodesulfobacteriota bacterium]|nr:acetate--CoA ligase [Thermodesulfobacteriota bacterium]
MFKETGMTSVMEETGQFDPSEEMRSQAHIKNLAQYQKMYQRSIKDPEGFWGEYAEELHWFKKWDKVYEGDFGKARIKWFSGGKLNAAYNCLDRHLRSGVKDKVAILWVGGSGENKAITYEQLHREVCRFGNVLKRLGIRRGDRVAIYLPMIPELPIAMLSCARIGAIHNVIFTGFSAESLRERVQDCKASLIITSNYALSGRKVLPTKANVDVALKEWPAIKRIVVQSSEKEVEIIEGRDFLWNELMDQRDLSSHCEPEEMDSEDPLFILHTSGSTGKPKGVLHTTSGYLLHVKKSFEWVFDYHPGDIYWCTEDMSWIIGHSYGLYGPLCSGATSLMFEGTPNHPKPDRFWEIVEKYRVNIFYTTPAALRLCMRERTEWVERHDLSSLRLLGSVGEPIGPKAWMWYYTHVGAERCPIVDTWWQTETGGILITPLPGAISLKPGSAALPFFGADPAILREDGSECEVNEGGYLVMRRAWPGMMRGVFDAPEKLRETYFVQFPGAYFTGDRARRDEDGYFWLSGRVDDVIHSSGYRLGTTEIENALSSHEAVAEVAIVPFAHPIKGQGIYAFVTLRPGFEKSEALKKVLLDYVQRKIGILAVPDKIQWVDVLSKTLSGKIMRRILRKIASGEIHDLGDTSALANPSVVEDLIQGRQ